MSRFSPFYPTSYPITDIGLKPFLAIDCRWKQVEKEALHRLGHKLLPTGQTVLLSIALRMPKKLKDYSGAALKQEILVSQDFEIAIFTGENENSFTRWPNNGWLHGNLSICLFLFNLLLSPPK
jgi:hypothetical protein